MNVILASKDGAVACAPPHNRAREISMMNESNVSRISPIRTIIAYLGRIRVV